MKKSLFFIALFWILLLSGCRSVSVVEYNDSFVAVVKDCTDSTQSLFDTYKAEDSTIDSIKTSLDNSISICQSAKDKAIKIWDFKKDSSLKDAVVDLLSWEVAYLTKFWLTDKYRNIENITDDDKVAYDSIVNELYQEEIILNEKFTSLQQVQEKFALDHGLNLK